MEEIEEILGKKGPQKLVQMKWKKWNKRSEIYRFSAVVNFP